MESSQPLEYREQMERLEQIEQIEPLEPVFDLLETLISRYGITGIAAAMFAESAGVPFASIIVLLTAGTMILRGSFSFWSLLLASTLGITLGSIFSYLLGLLGSMAGTAVKSGIFHRRPNYKKVTSAAKKSRFIRLWEKYGNFSIFMAQLWGFSRTFGSIPAGAMHVNFFIFIIYTFLGGALFSFAYIAASIALIGTMSATLGIMRTVLNISPWLFIVVILAIAAAIYTIIIKKRAGRLPDFKKSFYKLLQKFNKNYN